MSKPKKVRGRRVGVTRNEVPGHPAQMVVTIRAERHGLSGWIEGQSGSLSIRGFGTLESVLGELGRVVKATAQLPPSFLDDDVEPIRHIAAASAKAENR